MAIDCKEIEREYIDSNELAIMLSLSRRWVEKHRARIAGAVKIGGAWRFKLADIRIRLDTGRDIVVK